MDDAGRLQAWGDESMRTANTDRPAYLLGAVVADPAACDDMRNVLAALPRRGPKLHWYQQEDRARRRAISVIAGFEVYHMVVVAAPIDPRRQERARALCLERLAWLLDRQDVGTLTLEARPAQLMRRDLRTIDALRGKHALPSGLRVEHAQPDTEPMLWAADQVLGALGQAMTGGRADLFDALRPHTTVSHIDL